MQIVVFVSNASTVSSPYALASVVFPKALFLQGLNSVTCTTTV